nr:hypothetical protein [Arthrobacter agilis]
MVTPSWRRLSRTIAAASRSSFGRISERTSMVTRLPSRPKACPISQAIGPPPMITSRDGSSARSQMVSDVTYRASPRPGISGRNGSLPVATRACRKRTVTPSSSAVPDAVKRSLPDLTSTPAASSVSGASSGSMVVMAAVILVRTVRK